MLMRDRLATDVRDSGVVVGGPIGKFDMDTADLAATTLAARKQEFRWGRGECVPVPSAHA